MKTRFTPALVGAFVLGALVLTVMGLISFGSARLFTKPGRFVAYFNESVQGLDLGSAVKLRGVRVGRVAAIRIRYDAQLRQSKVAVICELEHNLVTDNQGATIKMTNPDALQELVNDGLRAKLRLTGITGLQVIELDFYNPAERAAPLARDETGYPVMPTVPSEFAEFADSASEVLTRLKSVDFFGLTRELRSLLTNANAKISELDLKGMVARITSAADAVERLAGNSEISNAVTNLNGAIADVRKVVGRLDAQIEPLGTEARESLRAFSNASTSVRKALGPESGLREETVKTLQRLDEAAASVQRLADFLERNPNALLTGRKPPKE